MPLDRIVKLSVPSETLRPPLAGEFRTFGSPIGAGVRLERTGRTKEDPPWPADPTDSAPYRDLTAAQRTPNELRIFPTSERLWNRWVASQPSPVQPFGGIFDQSQLPAARRLAQDVTDQQGEDLAAMMVGREVTVGVHRFGRVVSSVFRQRSTTLNIGGRHGYPSWSLILSRSVPDTTIWVPRFGRYESIDSQFYVHGALDEVLLETSTETEVWAEIVELQAVDQLVIDASSADAGRSQVDAVFRIRGDERVTPASDLEHDGQLFEVLSVVEDIELGRGRFQRVAVRRYLGITR